jgi:hypothetical protein
MKNFKISRTPQADRDYYGLIREKRRRRRK